MQLELLNLVDVDSLDLKGVVKWGKSLLSTLRKVKGYLREDKENKYWLSVKQACLRQLDYIANTMPSLLRDPELDSFELMSAFELTSAAAACAYEEAKLDSVVDTSTPLSDLFTPEQLELLAKL